MIVRNGALILLAFFGFAFMHSLVAGRGVKDRLKPILGERFVEGWYRLAYNLFAAVTILPVFALVVLLPDRLLYAVAMPWSLIMRGVQALGVIGLVGALFVTDVWDFAGLKQAAAYLTGESLPVPAPPLQEKGMYRLVRHPLYFFTLVAIWPSPSLTVNTLFLNIGVTLYIVIGSLIEERRLERTYGDAYRNYRRRVSWLIPLPPHCDGDAAIQGTPELGR